MFDKTSVVVGGIDRDGRGVGECRSSDGGSGAARGRMRKRGCVVCAGMDPTRGATSSRGATPG
jgi:hypothetical protein